MSDGKRHQVLPVGNGRFVVVTTRVRLVTEKQLKEMGLEPPPPELPWSPEQPARPVPQAEKLAALHYWKDLLGGYVPQVADHMAHFLREFGLEGVKQAADQVAATHLKASPGEKYDQLVRVFQQMRERRAARAEHAGHDPDSE